MLKELKKKSIKSAIWHAVLCLLLAGALWFLLGGQYVTRLIQKPKPLDVANVEAYVGEYVTMDVMYVDSRYAYTTKKGQPISFEYMVADEADQALMGLYISKGSLNDKFVEWLSSDEPTFTVRGVVEKMGASSIRYFNEAMNELNYNPEHARHYYIKTNLLGKVTPGITIALAAGTVLLLALAAFTLIKAFTGGFQKSIRSYIAATPFPQRTEEEMDAWYLRADVFKNLRMGDKYILYQNGLRSILWPVEDIVWAYHKTVRQYYVISSHSVILKNLAKKEMAVAASNSRTQEILQYIARHYPWVALGYVPEIASLYAADPAALQQQKRAASQPPQNTDATQTTVN